MELVYTAEQKQQKSVTPSERSYLKCGKRSGGKKGRKEEERELKRHLYVPSTSGGHHRGPNYNPSKTRTSGDASSGCVHCPSAMLWVAWLHHAVVLFPQPVQEGN